MKKGVKNIVVISSVQVQKRVRALIEIRELALFSSNSEETQDDTTEKDQTRNCKHYPGR